MECTNCYFQFKAFPLIEWLRNYLWTSDLNCSHFYTDQSPICPTGEACVCSMTHSDNLGSMPDICVLGFFCFLADSLWVYFHHLNETMRSHRARWALHTGHRMFQQDGEHKIWKGTFRARICRSSARMERPKRRIPRSHDTGLEKSLKIAAKYIWKLHTHFRHE